jgi:hypothetical protein
VARLGEDAASPSAQKTDSAPDPDREQDEHHNGQGESVGKGESGPAQPGQGVGEKGTPKYAATHAEAIQTPLSGKYFPACVTVVGLTTWR